MSQGSTDTATIKVDTFEGFRPLEIKETSEPHQWTVINPDIPLEPVAHITGSPDATASVTAFRGKGGFTMIVQDKEIQCFGLPGSQISLGGISIDMPGTPCQPQSNFEAKPILFDEQHHINQATILGAGLATRFEPISGDYTGLSKPGVPLLKDRSVIRTIVDHLEIHGLKSIFINTYYKRDEMKAGLENTRATLHYIDEDEPSGTAGGLRKVLEKPDEYSFFDRNKPLLVVQGDAVTDVNFSKLIQSHVDNNAAVTIGCTIVPDELVHQFGIIVTDSDDPQNPSGNITEFQEKPSLFEAKSRLASTGFYIFSPESYPLVMASYAKKPPTRTGEEPALDFAQDIFAHIMAVMGQGGIEGNNGQPMTFRAEVVEGYWSDVGNPLQYVQALHDVFGGLASLYGLKEVDDNSFFDKETGVTYWQGVKPFASLAGAQLSGNVIVTPYTIS